MSNTATSQRKSLFASLTNLAEEIGSVKSAGVKSAAPVPADPGGFTGETTHPSKNEDNHGQASSEGSRSAENTADVKKQQRAPSVDSTSEKSQEGRQDEVQLNIGLNASATGEDASVEDDYKPGKDDPGSTHPARTDNDSLDGHKYASMNLDDLFKQASAKGNALLADLAVGLGSQIAPAGKPGAAPTKQASAVPAAPVALTAGYELAEAIGLSKEAAQAQVQDIIANTVMDAHIDADLLAGAMKQAADEDEAAGGEDHSSPEDVGSGAGEGATTPTDGGGAPAGGGGAPGGGDPMAGGAPSEAEALQELGMALQEMGLTPQDLLAMLQGGGGAPGGDPMAGGAPGGDPMAGGGAPPPGGGGMGGDPMAGGGMGGGGDPMAAMGGDPMAQPKMAAAVELRKIANAMHRHMRTGKFQIKASTSPRERTIRDNIKSHLAELMASAR